MTLRKVDKKYLQPGRAGIKIMRLLQLPFILHWHDFDELVIVSRGNGIHFTEKEEYPITLGDIFFIKAGEAHGYKNTDELEIINILYFPDKTGMPLGHLKGSAGYRVFFELEPEMRHTEGLKSKLNLSLAGLSSLEKTIKRIEEELARETSCGDFMATSFLMQLLGALSRLYEKIPDVQSLPPMRLGNLLSYLENNYKEKITLADLVRRFHISKSTLIRLFKKMNGETPLDYLLKIRIAKASELLKNPDITVTEAGLLTGFSDGNYFSRQFKRNTGISPKKFQKLLQPSNLLSCQILNPWP